MDKKHTPFVSLVDIARAHALCRAGRRIYTFLGYRPREEASHLSMGQLDTEARAVAARLATVAERGDRILLLFRPGLGFVSAFLGCLYAGMVAVPSTVPRFGQGAARLRGIAANAEARVALSSRQISGGIREAAGAGIASHWLDFEDIDPANASDWSAQTIGANELALLQYSSGSTGDPNGVMITHGNLVHQSALFARASGAHEGSCIVSWLPVFHDLGLVAGVLQPLYAGYRGVLMAPESFVEKPERWLKAVADNRADIIAAPNFAYEHCVRNVPDDALRDIDLGSLRFALNGAEPIRVGTLERFAQRFAPRGFDKAAFYPAYGLAEATLMVVGGSRGREPTVRKFDPVALEHGHAVPVSEGTPRARALVGSGRELEGQDILVVDPDTSVRSAPMTVGEVWVAGPSVGVGYWRRPEATEESFARPLAGEAGQAWLRTGDLGFICDGDLFVCGRLKDLILIRGRNHHAPDIEATVETSHFSLRPNCGAAFPIDFDGEERLVVVHEIDRAAAGIGPEEMAAIASAVRQCIAEAHEILVHAVVLLRHGTLPKTSSGKLQRRESRRRYLAGELKAVFTWSAPVGAARAASPTGQAAKPVSDQIQGELVREIARRLGVAASEIDVDAPLTGLRMNASEKLALVHWMEQFLRRPLPATLFEDFQSIRELFSHSKGASNSVSEGLSADELRQRMDAAGQARQGERIAIVGLGCRFPGADGPKAFWKLLVDGVDAVTEVPPDRWDIDELYDENPLAASKMNTRWGGFLKDIDLFDRNFFGLSIREAHRMDPQHRLMLELAWEALEDAGIDPDSLSDSSTGVFVGISGSDYAQMQFGDAALADAYAGLGCALTIAASRVSHFLNLRGPAIAVDTACSSSLSALHLACASLRRGECEVALVGGVNILLSPVVTMCLTKAGMMSPDGRCKAFDSRANGYVRADGAGLLVLKPMSKAIADGDDIYAVVRGTASNQDGRSSGIAAPNGEAQQRVVLAACKDAGVSPGELDYVEAHGTGTGVGDPIEVKALGAVLSIGRPDGSKCAIGSVKTNIGHAEAAAGVASLIKVAMILKHRKLPPSLHFRTPNPLIPFDQLPIRVQAILGELPDKGAPLLVGVNGFGVGGTNVHAILEEAPERDAAMDVSGADESEREPGRPWLLPLSARSLASLKAGAERLAAFLEGEGAQRPLAGIGHTLALRRSHMNHRLGVVAPTREALAAALRAYAETGSHPVASYAHVPARRESPKLAFVFSGQGSQWWAMGRRLLEREPVFRQTIERCDALLRPFSGWSLLEELRAPEAHSRLGETAYAQPAIFSLQVATADLWRSWGVVPDAVVGHSVGEVAAACVSGALTLEDAAELIAHRARIMQQATGLGCMVSVELSPEEIDAEIAGYRDQLSVAAVNSPRSVVLSGEAAAMDEVVARLQARGVVAVRLPVNYAFHSPQMEPFKHALVDAVARLSPQDGFIPMVSTVSGDWCRGGALTAEYWGENVRGQVRFAQATGRLAADGFQVYVEVGPHAVLTGAINRTLKAEARTGTLVASLVRDRDDQETMLLAFFALHAAGYPLDWSKLHPRAGLERDLPRYTWERQRYWLDLPRRRAMRPTERHPLLTERLPTAQPTWQSALDPQIHRYLSGRSRGGASFLPRGVFVELALACWKAHGGSGEVELRDLEFDAPLPLPGGDSVPPIQTALLPSAEGEDVLTVHVRSGEAADETEEDDGWRRQFRAHVVAAAGLAAVPAALALNALRGGDRQRLDGANIYEKMAHLGLEYVPEQHVVEAAWLNDREALVRIAVPGGGAPDADRYRLHPLAFEGVEQAIRVALGARGARVELVAAKRIRLIGSAPLAWVHVQLRSEPEPGESTARADAWAADAEGRVQLVAEGVAVAYLVAENGPAAGMPTDPPDWLYDVAWEEAAPCTETPDEAPAGWIVFADRSGTGDRVADRLAALGHHCVRLRRGEAWERVSEHEYLLPPAGAAESLRVLIGQAFGGDRPPCGGILHLWSLDAVPTERASVRDVIDDQACGSLSVLGLVQALASAELRASPRLWVVTGGSQPAGEALADIQLAQTPVWGLCKSIAIEHPELRCARIDMSGCRRGSDEEALLVAEVLADGAEDQIALRDDRRFVARLVRHRGPLTGQKAETPSFSDEAPWPAPYRVAWDAEIGRPRMQAIQARPPAADAVEIEVEIVATEGAVAAGGAEGTRRRTDFPMAGYTGRVTRTGSGVSGVAVGREVVALASEGIVSRLNVPAAAVAVLPQGVRAADVASHLRPVLAALLALKELACVKPGDWVLIHGADDEAGFVAATMAVSSGAKVIATARAASARARLAEIGAVACLNPEAPDLFADVRRIVGGRGAQIGLNLLGGTDLVRFLSALAPFGRCVDMAGCFTGVPADARGLRMPVGASLHSVDLGLLLREGRECAARLVQEAVAWIAASQDALPAARAADLSELLQQTDGPAFAGADSVAVMLPPRALVEAGPGEMGPFQSDATYLVTGGLGALGLSLALRMASSGVRNLVLLGRSAPSSVAVEVIEELARRDVRVWSFALDVADRDGLAGVLETVRAELPPLRGIVHAAGILDNGLLVAMTEPQFLNVFPAKVQGAMNLHELTVGDPLDFFLMFSSLASLLGSPGQGNYSAANAFLDGLAVHRARRGLPAVTVCWGPWAEIGMASDAHNAARLEEHGMGMLAPEKCHGLAERLMEGAQGMIGAIAMDWTLWSRAFPNLSESPFVSAQVPGRGQADSAASQRRLTAAALAALTPESQIEELVSAIHGAVCRALQLAPDQLATNIPLTAVGLDSIVALELKSRIESNVDVVVQTPTLLRGPSVLDLAIQFRGQLLDGAGGAGGGRPSAPSGQGAPKIDNRKATRLLERLDELSDEEVSELLSDLAGDGSE